MKKAALAARLRRKTGALRQPSSRPRPMATATSTEAGRHMVHGGRYAAGRKLVSIVLGPDLMGDVENERLGRRTVAPPDVLVKHGYASVDQGVLLSEV